MPLVMNVTSDLWFPTFLIIYCLAFLRMRGRDVHACHLLLQYLQRCVSRTYVPFNVIRLPSSVASVFGNYHFS